MKLWYCKAEKKNGKPIIVQDLENKKTYMTDHIDLKGVNIRMAFNNSSGKAKSSGATTILEVYKDE
jgi:hypothetical protein